MASGLGLCAQEKHSFDIERMAAEREAAGMVGVLVGWEAETHAGLLPLPNDRVAEVVRWYPGRFFGFAIVAPWEGRDAVAGLKRPVRQTGLNGLNLLPAIQEFYLNDRRFYPLGEKCVELGIPILTHTVNAGLGARRPGGLGLKFKHLRPIRHVDDGAADFPYPTPIMVHRRRPWGQDLLSVALHKGGVYIELSGWQPRYIPQQVLVVARTLVEDKCLFGTEAAFFVRRSTRGAFRSLGWDPDVITNILKQKPMNLFPC